MNKSYFYLEMKTHELKVPYTGKLRRVRVLLPKNYERILIDVTLWFISVSYTHLDVYKRQELFLKPNVS